VVPEGEELAGKVLRSCLRRRICCLHVRKYCTREGIFKRAIISGAQAFGLRRVGMNVRPKRRFSGRDVRAGRTWIRTFLG
jgi:hypothetical protein